jgi:hypothetical protein
MTMPAREGMTDRSALPPRAFAVALSGLSALYLVQTITPLRIDDDTVDYLRMAAAIADRQTVPPIPLPIGFPVVVSILDRAGLGSSFFFVLTNCIALGVGLLAIWLLRDYPPRARQMAMLFSLLSFPVVMSLPIALPDAAFFGCSLLALSWMSRAAGMRAGNRVWLLGAAFALTALATSIRTVGIALIPALIWCCLRAPAESEVTKPRRRLRAAWILATGVLVAALLIAVSRSYALHVYTIWGRSYYVEHGLLGGLAKRISWMASGWGEIVLNVPFSRLRNMRPLFVVVGVVSAFILAASAKKRPHVTPGRVYLLTYVTMLSVWPNPSPRLWMPIIPLLIAETVLAIDRLPRTSWTTRAATAYAAWFALTGVAALAYTSRISFSGKDFPKVYGKRGGLANPEITEGHPGWEHIKVYNIESRKVLSRYGGQVVGPRD